MVSLHGIYFTRLLQHIGFHPLKFFRASELFEIIVPTIWHFSISGQSPHMATPFFIAHWRIPQRRSQNTVLTPSTRQPWQLICSGIMGAWFNSAHSFCTQRLVVMYCCKICVAFFTVQPAICNHIFYCHMSPNFHRRIHHIILSMYSQIKERHCERYKVRVYVQ